MRNLTMLTDLYQMTMMNGYIQAGIPDRIAVFDLFYRKNPETRPLRSPRGSSR